MSISYEQIVQLLFVAALGLLGGIVGAITGLRKNDRQDRIASPGVGVLFGLIAGAFLIMAYRAMRL